MLKHFVVRLPRKYSFHVTLWSAADYLHVFSNWLYHWVGCCYSALSYISCIHIFHPIGRTEPDIQDIIGNNWI